MNTIDWVVKIIAIGLVLFGFVLGVFADEIFLWVREQL